MSPETNEHSAESEATQTAAAVAKQLIDQPFGLALVEIMRRLDELQLAYRNLGRSDNQQFMDLIISRLMNNPVFFERLSIAIINITKAQQANFLSKEAANRQMAAEDAAKADRESDSVGPETIAGIETSEADLGEESVQTAENGDLVKMKVNGRIDTQSAFFPFEGYTHQFFIQMGTDEEMRLAVVGGTVFYDGKTEKLNPNAPQGQALLASISASMRTLIEEGKETPDMFKDGRLAYFNMRQTVAIQSTPAEEGLVGLNDLSGTLEA